MLRAHPAMEEDPTEPPFRFLQWDGKLIRETMRLRFKPDVDPESVIFGTGYDRAALPSYAVFARLRHEGAIPSHVRFQAALPTTMPSGYMYVSPKAGQAYPPIYERPFFTPLHNIIAANPPQMLPLPSD